MHTLIIECNNLLKNNGFEYAICGGHALDIYLGKITRPHGDIDLSAYWEDRNKIISLMQTQGWLVYEAMGGGMVHLITDTDDQKFIKLNIFCVKESCLFFHIEPAGNNIYRFKFDHTEQTSLDYIEFLFNERTDNDFVYSENQDIRLRLSKAVLFQDDIPYFAPELALLYKSTDLKRNENRQDFESVFPYLPGDSKEWLRKALITAFPDGHEWIARLEAD